MKNRIHFSLTLFIIGLLILTSCITIKRDDPQAAVQTSVAQTVQAAQPQQVQQQDQQQQQDQLQAVPPTITPKPQAQLPPTSTPRPCNDADLVSETILDGTDFNPGDTFTKIWIFKNVGTCTWNTNYKLVFKSGDQMGAPSTKNLPYNVAPGGTVDISVNLTAPASAGTYQGYFKLDDDNGEDFVHNFWVLIDVVSEPFAVTGVSIQAIPPVFAGPCPFNFVFMAEITTNGPGTVTYYWTRSDGTQSGTSSIDFGSAGTKSVSTNWQLGAPGARWMKIYIDNPNHQLFGPANFVLTCVP